MLGGASLAIRLDDGPEVVVTMVSMDMSRRSVVRLDIRDLEGGRHQC